MSADVTRTDGGKAALDVPRQIFELLGEMHERSHALDGLSGELERSSPELFIALQKVHHWVQVAGDIAARQLAAPTVNDDGRLKRTRAGKRFRRPDRSNPR